MIEQDLISRRRLVGLAAAATSVLLPGCSGVLPFSRPPQLYTLTPKSTFEPSLPTVDWQLLVEIPSTSAGLDTARIALTESAYELNYFADRAWTTRAPEMVQTLIVESFENSDRIVSVGREAVGLRADYVLKTELREFQAEYDGDIEGEQPPLVRIAINAKLVRIPQRDIIANANFADTERPPVNQFSAIVAAFDGALGTVMRNMVAWALREGQADWQQSPRRQR